MIPAKPQPGTMALPSRMKIALERYRRRVWAIKLAEGALAAVFGLVMSYLAVFGLDRLFDTPAFLRAILLALGCVSLVILFPLKYYTWVWSHRRLDQVARLLRHRFPRFGDHLLGIVELAQSESLPEASRTLVEAAMRQVDGEFEHRDLEEAIPDPRHRSWAWVAGGALVLLAVVMATMPAASRNAGARWSMPWRDVARYTFARLEGQAERRVVPYAEPFTIEVQLEEDAAWKPEMGKATYDEQEPVWASREARSFRFELPPQTRDGRLSLAIGDARRVFPVLPKLRPALSALTAHIVLPGYLQQAEPRVEDVRGGAVRTVQGSAVRFAATATRDLAAATLDGRPQSVDGPHLTTESLCPDVPTQYGLTWRDPFGLTVREAQMLRIEPREDAAPHVSLHSLRNDQVVLSSEVLIFEVQAGDDFGVKRVGLAWQGVGHPQHNPVPSSGEKIVAAGGPTRDSMTVPATFSADRENIPSQSLRVRAFVEDYLPGRERVTSLAVLLHILTPADHFAWLTDQVEDWSSAAQDVYEGELALHEVNKTLLDLPPEALDDPAQRKTIEQQAAAEEANAARLVALVAVGADLLQEAAKNEAFDAGQLGSLADLLKTLEEIAGLRMPSVASLLARAAEAPPGTDSPGELSEDTKDPNAKTADVVRDQSEPSGGEGEPGSPSANPTPQVADIESGFNEREESEVGDEAESQVKGGLLIPSTTLRGSGTQAEEDEAKEPESPTARLVKQAVSEQQALLDDFARFAGEMNELLKGFENSTFVKRLKAASRRQLALATAVNSLEGFGLSEPLPEEDVERTRLADCETAESDTLQTLQEDIVAYADRKPSPNYTRVLREMQEADVTTDLLAVAAALHANEVGRSTIDAEYWADTLDRWAEQLVDPLEAQSPSPAELIELPSLAPDMVLEVMRIINHEIELREETRELDQANDGIDRETYQQRGTELSEAQAELAATTRALADRVEAMPNAPAHADATLAREIEELTAAGDLKGEALAERIEWLTNRAELGKTVLEGQITKLIEASVVMDEVRDRLAEPATGAATLAAISEVIEILLETHRTPNTSMVVAAPPATVEALALRGGGDDGGQAFLENRAPAQAVGKSGYVLPEEYRQGLDLYLNALGGSAE